MTDKREVEEIVLSQIPTKDRSCGWPAFWRDIVVPYREKELIAALTKISQLEEELSACTTSPGGCGYWREATKNREAKISQLEQQLAADREDLRVRMRALELMCNDFNILESASSQKFPSTVSEYLTAARQQSNPAAAEG